MVGLPLTVGLVRNRLGRPHLGDPRHGASRRLAAGGWGATTATRSSATVRP